MSPTPSRDDHRLWHLGCHPGELGQVAILTSEALFLKAAATLLENSRSVAANREFSIVTGQYLQLAIGVVAIGLGAPCMAIAVEELKMAGISTLIYVGDYLPLDLSTVGSRIYIPHAAIRDEVTSQQYVPLAYPALADPDLVEALIRSARDEGENPHGGWCLSTDSPYQHLQPAQRPLSIEIERLNAFCAYLGIWGMDLSASTLFTVARVLGLRSAALLHPDLHRPEVGPTLLRIALAAFLRGLKPSGINQNPPERNS